MAERGVRWYLLMLNMAWGGGTTLPIDAERIDNYKLRFATDLSNVSSFVIGIYESGALIYAIWFLNDSAKGVRCYRFNYANSSALEMNGSSVTVSNGYATVTFSVDVVDSARQFKVVALG